MRRCNENPNSARFCGIACVLVIDARPSLEDTDRGDSRLDDSLQLHLHANRAELP